MEIVAFAILDTLYEPPKERRRFKASASAAPIILGKQIAGMNRECRHERYSLAEIYADGARKIISAPPGPETWVAARVKSFGHVAGYGFVEVSGVEEDIFLYASTLPRDIRHSIKRGDVVQIQYVRVERGYHVVALKFTDGGEDA